MIIISLESPDFQRQFIHSHAWQTVGCHKFTQIAWVKSVAKKI